MDNPNAEIASLLAKGSISASNPSIRDKIAYLLADASSNYLGASNSVQRKIINTVRDAIDFVPLVGDFLGADDAYRSLSSGDYGKGAAELGAAALGLIPGVGDVAANGVRKGIRAWTGGIGDPVVAASGKGAWFSEVEDLAREYAGTEGIVRHAYISPSRPITFRHAEQQRSVGDFISTALEGGIIPEEPSAIKDVIDRLYSRYGDDKRSLFEYWNNDLDAIELLRLLGYDSISAAEKKDMAAQTWGILDPSLIYFD